MDEGVAEYIEALSPQQRPLFDRLHAIVLDGHPEAEVALAYGMPAYRAWAAAGSTSACGRTGSPSTGGGGIGTVGSRPRTPGS